MAKEKTTKRGRPKGAKNKTTSEIQSKADYYFKRFKIHPIQYLVGVMSNGSANHRDRITAAKILLEYRYGRPQQSEPFQVNVGTGDGLSDILKEIYNKKND